MIFPIGDDQVQGGAKPIFSYAFIAINILIFVYQMSLGPGANNFVHFFGAIPSEITSFQDLFTLGTSIFLHGSIMHLFGNMLYLWIFADNIEATVGNFHFFVFYLLGGLVALLAHILFNPASNIPTVGASGAISAIMGAYIVLFPKSKIKMIFLLFFKTFYISALLFLGYWFLSQVFSTFFQTGDPIEGGVAWWAHIGGFAFGAGYAYLFFRNHRLTTYHLESEPKFV